MKKKKYEERKGLTGMGTDYSVFSMSRIQTAVCICSGAAAGAASAWIILGMAVFCAVSAAAGAVGGLYAGKKYFMEKRRQTLLSEFRDFLESVSASLSSGQNISGALAAAYDDISIQCGSSCMMAQELRIMLDGIKNGESAEELMDDFAERSGQRDIKTFADTFRICTRTGGNMRDIIVRTSAVLSDKMQTQAETEIIASKGRNELLLMTAMPFIIVPMLKTLGDTGISGINIVTVSVRIFGMAVIAASFYIGYRITDIRL